MIPTRYAPTETKNPKLRRSEPERPLRNVAWLESVGAKSGVILLGGTSLADFRIRVAQSHLRRDMTPSCWSLAGVLLGDAVATVPLGRLADVSQVPEQNGIENVPVRAFDSPQEWPNVAVLRFAKDPARPADSIEDLKKRRSVLDLPSLIQVWLGFIWGARGSSNPLTDGHGVPSAALVETLYALADLELTPSLASSASCPEAMWQAARYWYGYYEKTSERESAAAIHPTGHYLVRQESAAVALPPRPERATAPRRGAQGRKRSKHARRKA